MLFSSPEFIFAFLPLVFLGFLLSHLFASRNATIYWLIASSLLFYGWWNPRYLILIAALIVANFALSRAILAASTQTTRKTWLIVGLVLNLATLIYYKYSDFLLQNINAVAGTHWDLGAIVLPLGISFFTFQKIAFLIDTYHGRVGRMSFSEFSLFVLFFPQLIAGPIVHHAEVVPQFRELHRRGLQWDNIAIGLSVFFIGLTKKAVLADTLSMYDVAPVFDKVAAGSQLHFLEAWAGVLGYTLQLYFDFSGYSDMAIGAALLFGIRLPQNFNSPYKATSIIDFWRRWHITLSRFLRDYLYISLGGNRLGPARRYINLFLTMLLGGIWHGAGWTFLMWGALHGTYLALNHGWRALLVRLNLGFSAIPLAIRRLSAGACTFLAVVIGWVFFRADSFAGACRLLRAMFGGNGLDLPEVIARVPVLRTVLAPVAHYCAGSMAYGAVRGISLLGIAGLLLWCWLLPNPQQIFAKQRSALVSERLEPTPPWGAFFYDWRWVTVVATSILISVIYVQSNLSQEFLYFDF